MPDKALVVGISKYLPPTTKLDAPAAEADAWAALLPPCGISDVTVRQDSSATLPEVRARLIDLFSNAKPREKRVFVYCGHGTVAPIGGRMGDEALQLFHNGGKAAAAVAALTDSEMSAIIKAAKPSPEALLTIVLDCCFSGGFDVKPLEDRSESDDKSEPEGKTLYSPLLSADEFDELLIVHRFGSLWDRGVEFETINPLVVAACERHKKAAELPVPLGAPPHLAFSGNAIPALRAKVIPTHEKLCDAVNRVVVSQHSVLLGNMPRRPHLFFT
ncbi:MAG: caspase family protein [Acidobacteriota bacterium]